MKKLNGFNNGINAMNGVGGKPPAFNLVLNSKKRIIREVKEHKENKFLARYKGYDITIEREDDENWDIYNQPTWYCHVFNSEIAFGTAVDGVFSGTLEDVIAMCLTNILDEF